MITGYQVVKPKENHNTARRVWVTVIAALSTACAIAFVNFILPHLLT